MKGDVEENTPLATEDLLRWMRVDRAEGMSGPVPKTRQTKGRENAGDELLFSLFK